MKVALRFAATVLGAFAAALIIQRGTDTGQDLLRQQVTRNNPAYQQVVTRVQQHVIARGSHPVIAAEQAGSVVGNWVAYNAQMTGHRAGRRLSPGAHRGGVAPCALHPPQSERSILADDLHELGWTAARGASLAASVTGTAGMIRQLVL